MGTVSDHLRDLIAKQVDDRRLAVWFDPDQDYTDFAAALTLPGTTVARYDGSFFQLRHEVSPLLESEEAPRLVVYVPLAEEATENALIELTAAGVVLKPGQQPVTCNTRLSVIAKAALKNRLGPEQMQHIEKQVHAKQLTLSDLDQLVEHAGSGARIGVLAVIFGASQPEEVALKLLASDALDEQIASRRARADVAQVLAATYGVAPPPGEALDELRARFARHILYTDLLATLGSPIPQTLATLGVAPDAPTRDASLHLAHRWRQSLDLAASYTTYADRVEQELGLAGITFSLDQVRACETCSAIEAAAQAATAAELVAGPSAGVGASATRETLTSFAERRGRGFWAGRLPEIQQRWALIATAGHLLLRAGAIEDGLKSSTLGAGDLFRAYSDGEHPWCELDTHFRQLEQQARHIGLGPRDEALRQLIALTRRRYMDVGDHMAARFTHAYAEAAFDIADTMHQREVFERVVAPAVRDGKTAYLLVDALRFEMARELVRGLAADHEVTLEPALGTVPSITEIGMAALMPQMPAPARVVAVGPSKLGLAVGDAATTSTQAATLRDRKGRIEWLKAHGGLNAQGTPARVSDVTLDDLLTLRAETERAARAADLLLVTSVEIDALAESDNISLAWALMEQLLSHVARGIRRLADLGCRRIFIAADHGYLFGEELDAGMKLDPPGGRTADLHRRVWVGTGGARSDAYLHARLAQFGLSDADLEIAVPWGFGAFKVQGGARAYFHGGMSLPELVVPVVQLIPTTSSAASTGSGQDIAWQLTPGSRKITAQYCSLVIAGHRVSLFDVAPPLVRVELRAGRETIARAVAATYGFREASGEIEMAFAAADYAGDESGAESTAEGAESAENTKHTQAQGTPSKLRPNTITLVLTRTDLSSQDVTAHLLDARTNRELARAEGLEVTPSLFTL